MVRRHNFMLSSDGYGAGERESVERPFGHADPAQLGAWAFATASWPNRTDSGGSRGLDDYMVRDLHRNIGAEIMGRNTFAQITAASGPMQLWAVRPSSVRSWTVELKAAVLPTATSTR